MPTKIDYTYHMGLPASKPVVTPEEYLALETKSDVRHEFHDGEILAMSGGTYEHSSIAFNVGGELRNRLKGSNCTGLESNMRVRVNAGRYVYPDLTIVCGKPLFDPKDINRTTITNPRLIVEVLSESTEAYDRGAKFFAYCSIPSFEEYILVSQSSPRVEIFTRQSDGTWVYAAWSGLDAAARVRTLNLELPLSEIYAGIAFPPENPA